MAATDALARAIANAELDPFTRRRLPAPTVRAALAALDAQRADLAAALQLFADNYQERAEDGNDYVVEPLGDAWNALHDAVDSLDRLRARIEDNPRPIPEHERGTWELVKQNID